ncbi:MULTISPECIES: hypothetical protein [Lacticaseibacillus]|uniref:hypothetical protein n=1 Tax=Lacticaseibacillus TaxID=2759736 RepID=UPI00101082E1|nr:hypothetical protein [Lacticaseibacillus casei]MBI6598894.1 hypothetical protein [Lacticaseibacillus casei]MBO1482563.1 hypothetical protein [Lacticaseibacillus casei]MBO2417849.1 hypothetical protein [Lacticaseibacillus casei]MCK2082236.1 hypothetical protein [Lacticaseibacillus casei]NIG82705.1 hypothetical protein [Lacticaseibacillus casei]
MLASNDGAKVVHAATTEWYSYDMSFRFSRSEVKTIYKRFESYSGVASVAGFNPKLSALAFYFGGAWGHWSEPFRKAYDRGTGLTVKYTYQTQGTAASGRYTNTRYVYE